MWEHIKSYRELYFGLSWFSIFMVLFAIFAVAGFPGDEYDSCFYTVDQHGKQVPSKLDTCWCESFNRGNIKEPSNTWSNLGFVLAGLMILWRTGRDRTTGAQRRNRFVSPKDKFYPTLYGNIVLFMGPGSMLYHGSLKFWADVVDQMSMFLFVGFFCSYSAVQLWSGLKKLSGYGLSTQGNLVEKIAAGVLFVAYATLQMVVTRGGHHGSSMAIGLFVGLAMLLQVIFVIVALATDKTVSFWRRLPYEVWGGLAFLAGLVAFGLALVVHANEKPPTLAGPGESNCLTTNAIFNPQSWLQAHALWQIFAAVMTFCVYWFFRFERSSTTQS